MTSRPPPLQPEAGSDRLQQLERSNRSLSLLLRSAPLPVLLLGPDLRIAHHSAPLADVVRAGLAGAGTPLRSLEWQFDMDWLPAAAERVRDSGAVGERTVEASSPDARYLVRVLPWASEDGPGVAVALQPLDWAGGIIDQQRCRQALAGMQIIRHQVSNTMLLMRSVIRRSAESAVSLEDYVMHLEARLDSIYGILAEVIRNPQATFDLREMIEAELEAQGADHAGVTWTLDGPRVAVPARAAQILGLVFQEMVTNAIQHGAIGSEAGGDLRVTWAIDAAPEGPRLHLDWAERGGFPAPQRAGFGTTVLESVLPYHLDGRATRSFGKDGLRITLTIPMASLASRTGELPHLF